MKKIFHHANFMVMCALCPIMINSCTYQTGIRQPEQHASIQFTGNAFGSTVYIEGLKPFKIANMKRKRFVQYQVRPGKYLIKVVKNGQTVVEREILVNNQTAYEVFIP